MRSTFKITFYVNRNKKKEGLVPIVGRITINGSIAQFSCKQHVDPKLWDVKSNRATGRSNQAIKVNHVIDNIRVQISKHYQRISDREAYVSAEMVRNAWQGIGTGYDSLLAVFDKYNEEYKKRAGKDRSKSTYAKYLIVRKHLAGFIKSRYRRSDIQLREITEDFINDFTLYLRLTVGLAPSTVWLYCAPLKMIVMRAHKNGTISSNPFAYFHISPEVGERGYLLEKELSLLMRHKFDNPRLEIVRDIFVFASFTGLSYIDIKRLTPDKIVTLFNGDKWIVAKREKTKTQYTVKLLDVPLRILERYERSRVGDCIFKVPTNCICNKRLKEIAKVCGINRYVTFHMSRHSFATLALTKGVPIESVSRMLGHTKITTTQVYAKITNEKIGQDMDMLSQQLDKLNCLEMG